MTTPESVDRRQLLKNALVALDEMQAKLDAVERARTEPIAIVGMGCRYPGGVNSPDDYWRLLVDGVDAIRPIPTSRLDTSMYADADVPTQWYVGFLDSVDGFDPQFFGISPREALSLDPQQRLVLEVGWEALENAGQAPDQLNGSSGGVFIGISTNDYAQLLRQGGASQLDVYSATGSALNAAPGRLSYTLGLNGPCMAIDTACSSSLVALHVACHSLRSRECDFALAGGVNTVLMPEAFICFLRWGMMASDGRCKTFDVAADGFVRSEGCGIIVLKRLSDAQANGDRILAVIRGSAVNQDGRSSGLTVPNGPAQEAVIRKALASAGVQPSQVSYVETHGTGTAIGDPIEVEAIGAALGAGRPKDLPLVIGAVKSNIGHAESASGIAGVIKTVLMLQQGEIPRNLHFHEPSPRIPWPDFPVVVPTEHMPWTPIDGKRIAGISGFGFSGTNAHVILEEAPLADFQPSESDRPAHILALSGRDANALRDLAGRYADFFAARPDLDPGDVGYTANRGRAQFTQRLAVVGATTDELRERLAAFAAGEEAVGLVSGAYNPKARARVAFLFTGQGSQYAGMGRQLYETQPVFRAALDQCAALLAPHLDQPLLSVLFPAEGAPNLIDQTTYTQPALFALEYALAQMWRAWGVEPSMVMGHSVGEYVAACIAGVFSLEDGLKLIAARGRLMGALPAGGAMAAVFADAERVRAAVEPYAREVSVAAYNGPENIVISGAATVIDTLLEQFKAEGIKSRRLVVSHAFHSPLMDPILAEFERVAAQVQFSLPRLKLISNRSGATAGAEIASARYWRDHIREAVQFSASIQAAQGQGATIYLEIGPGTTLLGMGQRIIQGNAAWLPSLRPGKDDWSQTLESLGRLYIEGLPINWDAFDQPYARRKIALPTYPFQRERYWTNASAAPSAVQSTRSRGGHPLLGERIPLAGNAELLIWENEISLRRLPYLDDHRVQGAVIVPATAYMEMGLAAVVEAVGPLPLVVRAVQNRKPLFLRDGDTYTSQLTLTRGAGDEWHFDVYSRAAGQNWTHHVSGTIAQADAAPSLLDGFDAQAIMARCTEEIRGEAFYAQLAEKGNQWGPTFQGIENLWRGAGEALSFVRVPNAIAGQLNAYQIHPAVADSCGHVLTATISMQRSDDSRGGAFVGGGVDETRVYARPSGTGLWCYARLRPEADGQDKDVLIGDVAVYDEAGTLISETLGAKLWYLDRDAQTQPESVENWFYTLDWQPLEDQEITAAAGNWLLISEANTLAHEVAAQLAAGGGQALVVNSITEASAALAGITDLHGVIYLNAIKQSDIDQAATAPADVLALLQTALTMIWAQPPRIWLVTRGAQSILGEAPVLAQSPLWGFGRSVALEASEFWGGLIDLDPIATPEESARHIWQAVQTANTGEDQQAFREGQRFGARLVRQRLAATDAPFHARPDGSYLITGGLGGLGLALARWLAQHGARRLILMGRTALPPRIEWQHVEAGSRAGRQIATIRELETLGVSVHLAAVDVGDEAQLRAYLDTYQAEGWPPIRGVIHAAGVMQYQSMQEHSPAEMRRIFQPKVQGGWLLHTLLPEVETFVMFSSVSSLLSSPLIGSYAAANTFLDALTYYRRAQGLPALTINWGAWGEVGMVADFGGADGSNQLMQPMSTENALDAFGRALRQPHPQVAVMAANWQRWEKLFSAMSQPPFLSAVMGQREPSAQPDAPGGFSLQSVLAAPEDERPTLIVTFLAEQSSRVMGFSGKTFDTSLSLSNLGMDSLMAVELKNRIETHLRVVVPMAQLLQGPSVDQLASIVLEQLAALDTSAVAAESADDRWEEGEL